ncbi:hypothetical protein Zmor_021172 [Zophobas morio]|uniref:Peptidase S1 domain-containing protein n=1 Tax=Zophobas morio TaxID=2755281 RepID=A0AA38I5Q0_9CUCU|nr:hypothetical protein Zmor_021172 [Zophobas morio]
MSSGTLYMLLTLIFFETTATKSLPYKSIQPQILNGNQAYLGQFPWQVALSFYGLTSQWECSGVLIKEDWVLTAGHCGAFEFVSVDAFVGSVNDSRGDLRSFAYDMGHPSGYSSHPLVDDIGLLHLEEPLEINDNVKPIDLSWEPLGPNLNITVSGWGATNEYGGAGPSSSLFYITLSTIDNTECKKTYGEDTIRDEMVCAVSTGNVLQATCFGDNGGPAIVYTDGKPVLVGIASFVSDRGCESGDPSGFTRIGNFEEWIRDTTGL